MSSSQSLPEHLRTHLSLLVRASIVLHFVALAAIAVAPAAWPWYVAAVLIDHAILVTQGLWPRSQFLGRNHTCLGKIGMASDSIALTIDDGPDPEVTPRILELLERAGAKATFFCIGERACRHPELIREIVQAGHAVENHTHHHSPLFWFYGIGRLRREIELAQTHLTALALRPPRFFRAPAGLRSPLLDPVLQRLGLQLVSWTRRGYDTREQQPRMVAERLTRGLVAGNILLVHDGNAARDAHGTPIVLEVLPLVLAAAQAKGYQWVLLRDVL